MKKLETGFTDKYGHFYPSIKALKFDSLEEFRNESMSFKYKSIPRISSDNIEIDDDGVCIYQSNINPNVGYRIYRDINFYQYNYHEDECSLLEELSKRQGNITLTEFPDTVVAVRNPNDFDTYHVIGTQMRYYDGHKCFYDTFNEQANLEEITYDEIFYIYRECLRILMELQNNGVCYSDVHRGNFLIRLRDLDIKLIDFEKQWVHFNDYETNMIRNTKRLIRDLNETFMIGFESNLEDAQNLQQIKDVVDNEYKLVRGK